MTPCQENRSKLISRYPQRTLITRPLPSTSFLHRNDINWFSIFVVQTANSHLSRLISICSLLTIFVFWVWFRDFYRRTWTFLCHRNVQLFASTSSLQFYTEWAHLIDAWLFHFYYMLTLSSFSPPLHYMHCHRVSAEKCFRENY